MQVSLGASKGTHVKIKTASTFVLVATSFLSGCTALPNSGPDSRQVEAQATAKVTSAKKAQAVGIDYALVDISKSVLAYVEDTKATSLKGGFGGGRGGAPSLPLGVGDVVQVSVFESQSGGLFIPNDAGSRPGNYVSLPNQTSDREGTISVPYAGRIPAAGCTARTAQIRIRAP